MSAARRSLVNVDDLERCDEDLGHELLRSHHARETGRNSDWRLVFDPKEVIRSEA